MSEQSSVQLKLEQVPGYVKDKTGKTVSKMTVYNWVSKGVQGHKLKITYAERWPKALPHLNVRVTTPAWVDEFLSVTGRVGV